MAADDEDDPRKPLPTKSETKLSEDLVELAKRLAHKENERREPDDRGDRDSR